MNEFITHTQPDVITEFAMHLMAFRDDHYDPMGSAILIRPNLLLTARHVFDDYWAKFDGRKFEDGMQASFACHAFQKLLDGRIYELPIRKVWTAPWSDLALLLVESAPEREPMKLRMSMAPPKLGSTVRAFGYHGCKANVESDSVIIERDESTSAGVVEEIHWERRDNYSITWPCFRVNARFDGGMSGGPVFNEGGQLCGLVCACMPPSEPGEPYVSYVTMLWPMLAIEMDVPRDGHPVGMYPVLEMVRGGSLEALGWEAIELAFNEDGRVAGIGYRH